MRRFILLVLLVTGVAHTLRAQQDVVLQPYTKWDAGDLYNNDSLLHTAFKPVLYLDTAATRGAGGFIRRKLFEEHHLMVNDGEFHLYGDFLPDFQIGNSRRDPRFIWKNTRGARVWGSIGRKVYFEAEDFETQQQFPGYIDSFINKYHVIPRLDNFRKLDDFSKKVFDFNYASARIVYRPWQFLQFDLGYGKNFVGDGYRSLLLSDWTFNYPYFHVTGRWNNFSYSVMWSQYISRGGTPWNSVDTFSFPREWGQTFFLDWHFTPRGNIGIFESMVWPNQTSGHHDDINWSVLSPVIFLHGNRSPSGTPAYNLTGLNAKYKILPHTYAYGQLAFSNFLRTGAWKDRFAWQAGIRSTAPFGLQGVNMIMEYNLAKPYMYAGSSVGINYAQFDQPLAHPMGAAFKEGLVVITYRYKKWWFRTEGLAAVHQVDTASTDNGGGDILKVLPQTSLPGIRTRLFWGDFRMAYQLNPVNNWRVEAGITLRKETNRVSSFRDVILSLGLRGSFRDLIRDF